MSNPSVHSSQITNDKNSVWAFWYRLAHVFYLVPKKYRENDLSNPIRATDTDKFVLFVLLTMGELFLHGVWYVSAILLNNYINLTKVVEFDVLKSLAWFVLALFSVSILFIVGIINIPENSKRWFWLQGLYVFSYLSYGIIFTLAFGENTSAVGIMFLGNMILGLFLLRWRFIFGAYVLSIVALIVFMLNQKLNYIILLPSLYPALDAYNHVFWQISYLYFTVPKASFTVLSIAQVLQVLELQEKLIYRLSEIDTLTGVYNRRSIYVYLDYLWQYRTSWQAVGMIYFDLDRFKNINDVFGHTIGDQVLIHSVEVIKKILPKNAQFGRLGGEEFIIILPKLQKYQTELLAEQIRKRLEDNPLLLQNNRHITQNQGNNHLKITASFGVACLYRVSENRLTRIRLRFSKFLRQKATAQLNVPIAFDKLINRADESMYIAKETGRNQVVCAKTLQFVDNI